MRKNRSKFELIAAILHYAEGGVTFFSLMSNLRLSAALTHKYLRLLLSRHFIDRQSVMENNPSALRYRTIYRTTLLGLNYVRNWNEFLMLSNAIEDKKRHLARMVEGEMP